MNSKYMRNLSIRALITLLVTLIVAVILVGFGAYLVMSIQTTHTPPTIADTIRTGEAPRPSVTPSSTIKALSKTKGFQALISYTDRGFEPANIALKKGDTVRFINNSSGNLQVAIQSQVPSAQFAPQQFWEFTFDSTGSWNVTNQLDASKSATIRVE